VTLLDSRAPGQAHRAGTALAWQVRAEIMKIRTTSTWWVFLSAVVLLTAAALWTGAVSDHFTLDPPLSTMSGAARAQAIAGAAQARTPAGLAGIATHLITSGQFFGVMFAMLIGVLAVTNEFAHQTATATFLANPRRTEVIVAKLIAAACFGALFWLSLLAYVLWAVLGVGLGALVGSQLAAVITGLATYLAGFAAVELTFHLIYNVYRHGWVLGAPVIAPAVATMVMITPGRAFPHAPPQWAGLVIMAGYALVLGAIGVAVTRRRDVT